MMISRFVDEPTGTLESVYFLCFQSNVANSVETKVKTCTFFSQEVNPNFNPNFSVSLVQFR